MIVQVIIERLRQGIGTKSVFGAAEFYHARENTAYTQTPSYFVIQQNEAADTYINDDPFFINQVIQIVAMTELKPNDPRGEAAFYDVKSERKKLFSQMLGWVPDLGYRPTQYVSGGLIETDGKRIFYGYNFTLSEQIDPACDGFQGQDDWDEIQTYDPQFKVEATRC